ncbi:MAG: Jag N-terminal domain-containing protein [Clostridia bacterium]|nr:Jag N-terminal domain-containing protein [Clostridia bacterium]
MNETYLIMAKTVEEAIAIANREYAKDGKEVTYEILEMPKKGFLGIGARDAKIKITVSESESSKIGSELSSLVADLRGMKVHTNRGGSEGEEKPKKQSAPNQKKPNAPQQGQQGQKKPAEKQAQNGQTPKQNAQKPAQPKAEAKPQQAKPAEKPAEPKKDKPQEAKKPQVQKPKAEGQPKSEAKPQKPAEPKPEVKQEPKAAAEPKKSAEPKPERQPKPEAKAEKPAEPKMPKEPKEPKEPKMPKEPKEPKESKPAEPVTAEIPVETAAEPAKTEYKSSLRNQAKPQRRQKTPKSAAADAVPGAEAIISAPMGLTDFTREENASSFGSESSSGGRMSNDIRKKPRHPKQAIQPEQIAENIKEAKEYKEVRPEIEEAVLPALDANEEIAEVLTELSVAESAEIAESAESEASEAPAVEEDRLKVGVTEAEMQYALDFTNTLLKNMAIGATASRVECPEGEEYVIEGDANVYPKINIDGDGTGILIGHHGETLDAVQYLVNLAALRQSKQKGGDYVKIVVDIENYRAKREETLRSLARRMAARAVKYKRNVFLEPMNAYERRIIHSELHSFENVSTHSVGADKNRKIIITYEGPDKAPQQPRREKEERGDKRENKQESRTGGSAGSGNRRNENRRPKKIQKMPIEKLPDFLASGTVEENDRFVEIED